MGDIWISSTQRFLTQEIMNVLSNRPLEKLLQSLQLQYMVLLDLQVLDSCAVLEYVLLLFFLI